jgi:hypothetical protein
MQGHKAKWRFVAVVALLLSCGLGAFAAVGADKEDAAKPLPPEIAKAWSDAGAEIGWMRVNENGVFAFHENAVAGAVPAFRFSAWRKSALAKLPDPEAPFGLDLNGTQITDAGLKELAGFKRLQSLNLQETPASAFRPASVTWAHKLGIVEPV